MDNQPQPNLEEEAKNIVLPPKKKRVKKRFTTREQILERIDKFTQKAKRQRESQRSCYVKAGQFRRQGQELGNPEYIKKAKRIEDEGDRWGFKADRLEKDVLSALRGKLAEFDTDPIPGLTTDRSVGAI